MTTARQAAERIITDHVGMRKWPAEVQAEILDDITAKVQQAIDASHSHNVPGKRIPLILGWRPIDSAPKNGTLIDLWNLSYWRCPNCRWHNNQWQTYGRNDLGTIGWTSLGGTVTHWMQLPDGPNGEKLGGKNFYSS